MLFSVIVPIYKVEKYLRECIDSILSQSFSDFELILVDDGSPDSCPFICDEYAKKDTRVKVVHKENGGATSSRKMGTEIATGDYIFYVDSDDRIKPNTLQTVAEILLKQSCDIICFGYETFPNRAKKAEIEIYSVGEYDKKQMKECIFPSLITAEDGKRFPPSIWGKAFKRELVTAIQSDLSDDIVIGEDSCVAYVCMYLADSIYITHDKLYLYRVENESLTRQCKKAFSWDEPLRRAKFYLKYMPQEQFGDQIARITAHSFFNVAVSVINTKRYKDAKKEIKQKLSENNVNEVLKQARFKSNYKEKIALFCLRHKNTFLMKLIAKVI